METIAYIGSDGAITPRPTPEDLRVAAGGDGGGLCRVKLTPDGHVMLNRPSAPGVTGSK